MQREFRLARGLSRQERDIPLDASLLFVISEGISCQEPFQLINRSEHDTGFLTKQLAELDSNLLKEGRGVFVRRFKEDVAALDIGADALASHGGKGVPQIGHFHNRVSG